MIIYSQTGAKPAQDAFQKILLAKKFAITFIKDNKYVIKREPTEEYLNEVFKEGLPYCISDDAKTATKSRAAFWNPKVISRATNGDWVVFSDYKMEPLGKYQQMDGLDVFYSDFKYKDDAKYTKPLSAYKALANIDNRGIYLPQILTLFTKKFRLVYGEFDSNKKRWLKTVTKDIARPFYYENCLYIGKCGGWCIDESIVDIDYGEMLEGNVSAKEAGRIESYCRKYIEQEKTDAARQPGPFSYDDKEYYECEMQAAFIVLFACKMLQDRNKLLVRKNVEMILDKVQTNSPYAKKNHCLVEDYFVYHIDKLCECGYILDAVANELA